MKHVRFKFFPIPLSTARRNALATMLATALLCLPAWALDAATEGAAEPLRLEPSVDQMLTTNLTTKLLTNYHYKDTRLDDELSGKILDGYVEMLDPNRSYFLADDLASFDRYRTSLDDALRHATITPAFDLFNTYSDRVRERVVHALKVLEGEFDFTVDEYHVYDRSEAPWATSRAELDELWRLRVKNDYLRLKMAGKEPADIVELLSERYQNLERRVAELNSDDVFNFYMNAFATSIEPHTAYLSPRSSENFEISMRLSLEGIGALLGRETEYTSIARVVPGGPADKDGRIKAGDRVLSVGQGRDGKLVDVVGWRVDDVVDLIRGPKDTVVMLEVLPEGAAADAQTTVIDIVRGEVKLEEQAASSRMIEIPREGDESEKGPLKIGVIELPVFYLDFSGRAQNLADYRSSTRDVTRLIDELKQQGASGLVIDLRNNGGGSLLEATTLTGLFIDRGPVVQVRSGAGRLSLEEDTSRGMAWDGPLAVLVNRYSASASEIFAAAIQDYGRGIIIGEPTFGKGTVQSLMDLDEYGIGEHPSMGQLKITQAQFFRVNGGSTQNRGVIPDIRLPSAGDPQEYGERSLPNALPWSEISSATYSPSGDLEKMVAVADFRYRNRALSDQEFAWLNEDIEEYNRNHEERRVSLLESRRVAEQADKDARLAARKAETGQDVQIETEIDLIDPETADTEVAEAVEDDAEAQPDLLLRESARIVADMVELQADHQALAQQFARLAQEAPGTQLN